MSPALPVVSGQQVVSALLKGGFNQTSQRGSHVKLRDTNGKVVIVPMHKELARGTLSSILGQSGLDVSKFIELL